MKLNIKEPITVIIVIIGIAALSLGYFSQRWLGADNIIEESVETLIEEHTGLSIDLSPEES